MLKIKDNVDLKELEKFGYNQYKGYYKKDLEFSDIEIFVDIEQRIIEKADQFIFVKVDNEEIADLIKADLVEKESDKK